MRGGWIFQILKNLANPSAQTNAENVSFSYCTGLCKLSASFSIAGCSRCWLPLIDNKKEKKKQTGWVGALQLLKRLARMLQSRLFHQLDGIFTLK